MRHLVLVASKIRVRLDHRRLDVRLRLRIKVKHHEKGTYLRPARDDDPEAVAWIMAQAARWGTLAWRRTGYGDKTRYGWVLKHAEKPPGAL